MDVPLWAWVAVSAVIVAVLLVDLLVLHRDAHEVSMREAAVSSAVWVALGAGLRRRWSGRRRAAPRR